MSGFPAANRDGWSDVSVTVYGAGIAGLTAAHELAEHGFRVRVVEAERALGAEGRAELAVGGLARSQFGRAPRVRRPSDVPSTPRRLDTAPEDGDVDIVFAPGADTLDDDAAARLAALVARAGSEYRLRIAAAAPEDPLGMRRVAAARRHLIEDLGLPGDRVITDERRPSAPGTLRVGLDAAVLPGEHGFRFFPSYYRHVFDTMRRIPLVDSEGRPTGRTVLDRLVSTPVQAMLRRGAPVLLQRRTPTRSPARLAAEIEDLLGLGYTKRDIAQLLVRVLRYMCTSSERRAAELSGMSWWQYLCGFDPRTGVCRYGYSETFTRDMLFSTRVLAAFDAEQGDAHTNGDTYVQLFLNRLVERDRVDAVLDGPTSTAWFQPWREHLARLGVTFHEGRLEELRLGADGRVEALVRGPDGTSRLDERTDYIVVATCASAAEEVSRPLPAAGVPARLRGFTTVIERTPRTARERVTERRDPRRACGLTPWDRLQTLTGVQFFFAQADVKVARGHLYFLDAPWGLSAICSQQLWSVAPRPAEDGYRSVLSVDVGEWKRPVPMGEGRPPASAADLPLDAMAAEVYRQVCEGLAGAVGTLPAPAWYHVDTNLVEVRDAAGEGRTIVENRSPYLIPIAGEWDLRPAGEPWVPGEDRPRSPDPPLDPGVWQAPHGGYLVHHGGLVYAGTYMRTFTRMTTMESANESGRHAANAILDHVLSTRETAQKKVAKQNVFTESLEQARTDEPPRAPPWLPAASPLEGPDEHGASRPFATTPLGDYSPIWPIADHELPDLAPARAHDAEMRRRGLPHPWDLSGVETMLVLAAEGVEGATEWASLLRRVLDALVSGLGEASGGVEGAQAVIEGLRDLRARIEGAGR